MSLRQYGLSSERVLGNLLHAGGAMGLVAIVSLAYWLAAAAPQEDASSGPGPQPAMEARQLRTVHAELVELDGQLKTVEARVREGSGRIPPEPRESEFLKDLMRTASEAGLTVRDYRSTPPITKAGCSQISVHLSGAGGYRNICRFLDGVDRLARLTTVEKLEIAANPAAAGTHPFSVAVAVYFTGRTAADGKNGAGKNG